MLGRTIRQLPQSLSPRHLHEKGSSSMAPAFVRSVTHRLIRMVEVELGKQFSVSSRDLQKLYRYVRQLDIKTHRDLIDLLYGSSKKKSNKHQSVLRDIADILQTSISTKANQNKQKGGQLTTPTSSLMSASYVAEENENKDYASYIENELDDIESYDYRNKDEQLNRQMGGRLSTEMISSPSPSYVFPKEPNHPVWNPNTPIQTGLYGGGRKKKGERVSRRRNQKGSGLSTTSSMFQRNYSTLYKTTNPTLTQMSYDPYSS